MFSEKIFWDFLEKMNFSGIIVIYGAADEIWTHTGMLTHFPQPPAERLPIFSEKNNFEIFQKTIFRHDHVMVDPAGLEPATNRLWADASDQLS